MFSLKSLFASKMLFGGEESLTTGSCPAFTRQENFDLEAYEGRWYEQVRDKTTIFEIGADCVCANYSDNGDGTTRVRNNSYTDKDGWSGGTAVAYDIGVSGGLFVSFNGKKPDADSKPNYNVLSTDYENYTIVYDCTDYGRGITGEVLWILGREPVISDEVMKEAEGIIAERLPSYDMSKRSHYTRQGDSCPYDSQPE